jgi:hypothetical protein
VVQRAYHAALSAGWGYQGYLEISEELGLKPPSEKSWYRFQEGTPQQRGWSEVVEEVSAEDMAVNRREVIERDGEGGTVVYLDARFDSSREGYHGTVPVLDMLTGKVLALVTLTRKETGSSWKTEDAAVRQALEELEEGGVNVVEGVHDDKASVDGILAEYGIWSSKDLRHKCKSLTVKFRDDLARAKREGLGCAQEARATCDLKTLCVRQLQEHLKAQGLPIKGKKDVLVERVWASLDREGQEVDEDTMLLKFPELSKHDLTAKLKTHVYTACRTRALAGDDNVDVLVFDIRNAALQWAGSHLGCEQLDL